MRGVGEASTLREMSRRYLRAVVLAVATVAYGLSWSSAPVSAQIGADQELSPYIKVTDGVGDPDPNAVTALLAADAAVWDIEVIGNTVYVGGTFTTVTEKWDLDRHAHSYLAAFDGSTGEWIDWWRPEFDGPVYSLDSTSDGNLLVGGEFKTVNGRTDRAGLVALDAVSAEVVPEFNTNVERRWTDAPMVVRDLETFDDRLYVAGNFNHVNGVRVYKAVRLDRGTGTLDPSFIPAVTGRTAYSIAESADGTRVHIGGQFSAVDAAPGTAYLATVDASTAELVPGWAWDFDTFCCKDPKVLAMAVVGDNLFVAGSNDFWAMVSSTTGETRRLVPQAETQDPQVIEVLDGRVYIGCHCSKRGDWMSVVDPTTGEHLESFSSTWTGSDGGWAVGMAPDGCLWSGGAFTSGLRAENDRVFAGSLIRSCPVSGPVAHGIPSISPIPPEPGFECQVEPAAAGVKISWTDLGANGYDLIEDGGPKRWVRSVEAIDLSPGVTYEVVAWGNNQSGKTSTCENPAPGGDGFVCTVERVDQQTAKVSWTDIGARGYDVIEDGGTKRWTVQSSLLDPSPGASYKIVSWGNGLSGQSTECVNPDPGGGLQFVCTLADPGDGTRIVSWTDIGAKGYDVLEDTEPKVWSRSTSLVDRTPGQSYEVVAWGNGYSGERTTCG